MKNTVSTPPPAAQADNTRSQSLLHSQGELTYDYDADGRLTMVANQHTVLECYIYNKQGVSCLVLRGKGCTKNIEYTAFGIPLKDSHPTFIFPLGFAGGLHDPFTGFVRLGVRDYDPVLGRFTCPDPARDFGRDGDFYDYCMDDPINYVDATGLWAFPALLGGKAVALALGGAGTWGAAKMADSVKSFFAGKKSRAATDAVTRVSPMVAGTVAGSTLASAVKAAMIQGAPAAATLAAQAGTAGGKAAMDLYQKNEATILEGLGRGKEILSGYGMPPSMPGTKLEGSAHVASLLTYYENTIREGISTLARNWDETKHPRNFKTGEFIHK